MYTVLMRPLYYASLLLWATCIVRAQKADQPLTFEVASVKVSEPAQGTPTPRVAPDPGRFTRRATLYILISTAYGLKSYQLVGPSWLRSMVYEVVAKVPDGATAEQQLVMLQNLLADRFGLKVHRETKEMPVYDLVIAKGGPKFREFVPPPPPKEGDPRPATKKMEFDADGFPILPPGGGTVWGPTGRGGAMVGAMREQIAMETLARRLVSLTGRPVNDETGLKGKYDLAMHWVMDRDAQGAGAAVSSEGSAPAAPDTIAGPDLFAALQSQLGLKLDPKKGMVEVTVVDHAEKVPTEN
jgi:uncharacterized protein (TIGR03435 family)